MLYNLICSSILFLGFFWFVGILVFLIVWVASKFSNKKTDTTYYKKVLKDLKLIKKEKRLSKTSYKAIKSFYSKKIKNEEKLVEKKSKKHFKSSKSVSEKKSKNSRRSIFKNFKKTIVADFSANLLLYLGTGLILSAAFLLVAFNWDQMGLILKGSILPIFTTLFLGFGALLKTNKKVEKAGSIFLLISELLMFFSLVGVWRFIFSTGGMMSFESYWFLAAAFFLTSSIVYYIELKTFSVKVISIVAVFNFILAFVLVLNMKILSSVFLFLTLNLIVFSFYNQIKDEILRKMLFIVSQTLNFLTWLFGVYLIFVWRLVPSISEAELNLSGNWGSLVIIGVLFVPAIYYVLTYIKTSRWYFYFMSVAFFLLQIIVFSFSENIGCGKTLILFTNCIFGLFIVEKYFDENKRKDGGSLFED